MVPPDPSTAMEQGENAVTLQDADVDDDHVRALQRCIAEARLRHGDFAGLDANAASSQEGTQSLAHELRVHQIELEMQNEALRESQVALDLVRARYFDLYDMAPIAYCTVSDQGLIWQANLAAASLFGLPRNALLNQAFFRRIFVEDQDIYYLGRRRLASSGESQFFELRLVKPDGEPFWADLTIAAGQDAAGRTETRVVLSDISERKKAEAGLAQARLALMEKNAELEMTRGIADNDAREQSDYVSNMRREIDARLHTILARLQTACSSSLTQAQRRGLDQIENAGKILLNRIDEHLDPAATGATNPM